MKAVAAIRAVVALVVALTGCGSTGETTTSLEPPVSTTSSTLPTAPTTAGTDVPTTTTQAATTTTAVPPETTTTTSEAPATTTSTVPPTPIAGPPPGSVWAVVGVAFDDVLNVRAGPGTAHAVVATLDPLADDVVVTGEAMALPRSVWWEIEGATPTGWVNASFLGIPGAVDDIASAISAQLGGIPVASTMEDLGLLVARARASTEPRSRIVVVVAPTVGDLGEVTVDVIGLGDDAIYGERLHVFGAPLEGGGGFSLKAVEMTQLCGRGVDSDELCV